jgi:hypothetical protein
MQVHTHAPRHVLGRENQFLLFIAYHMNVIKKTNI